MDAGEPLAEALEHLLSDAGPFKEAGNKDEKRQGDQTNGEHPAVELACRESEHAGPRIDEGRQDGAAAEGEGHGEAEEESAEKKPQKHDEVSGRSQLHDHTFFSKRP